MRNYLDVDVKNIPYIFQITLVGDTYDMRVDYNEVADYYTITIWHNIKNPNLIYPGNKIRVA